MSIYKNGKLVAGGRQATPLLSFMWADHILDDISWLRADTFSWQSGAVYQAVYQHLADDIDGKSLQSETVGGTTIQFYLADDGHKICPESEISNVIAIYNAVGIAWYYVIDTVNERFKLPRTKFGFTGLRNNVGEYVAPGIPNITGVIDLTGISNHTTSTYNSNDSASSALYNNESITAGRYHTDSSSTTGYNRIRFNASRSSALYGASDTIQPPATQMYLYFYVGAFTQTALENTAGIVSEDFNELNQHKVIAFQAPTAENNYTWYRKYADGWVEMGGLDNGTTQGGVSDKRVDFPLTMADANYYINCQKTSNWDGAALSIQVGVRDTTGFNWSITYNSGAQNRDICWEVKGMAA